MTCAKVVVKATLTMPDGKVFVGENFCINPQEVCPRGPNEDYEKCRSICNQPMHAECNAIWSALATDYSKDDFTKATMHVAHKRICHACQEIIDLYGIKATHE